MGCLSAVFVAILMFAGGLAACIFYGLALGSLIDMGFDSKWEGLAILLSLSAVGVGLLNFAWHISSSVRRYVVQMEHAHYHGPLLEPIPGSKTVPTLGVAVSDIFYLIVACSSCIGVILVRRHYQPPIVTGDWLALAGVTIGVIMGLRVPFYVAWGSRRRPGEQRGSNNALREERCYPVPEPPAHYGREIRASAMSLSLWVSVLLGGVAGYAYFHSWGAAVALAVVGSSAGWALGDLIDATKLSFRRVAFHAILPFSASLGVIMTCSFTHVWWLAAVLGNLLGLGMSMTLQASLFPQMYAEAGYQPPAPTILPLSLMSPALLLASGAWYLISGNGNGLWLLVIALLAFDLLAYVLQRLTGKREGN